MIDATQVERSTAATGAHPVAVSYLRAPWASLLAFSASAADLVLELLAARMLAPFVGSSLYTWTSIIGVVLAGVSLGNWLGGRVADRDPSPRVLGGLFLLGGGTSIATLAVVPIVGGMAAMHALPLLGRIFLLSTIGFLPPSLLLGMIVPVLIRRLLPDLRRTGRVVGTIYAWGTLGSLAGNFATGFVLTAYFTVTTIVLAVGALLLVLGLLSGNWLAGGRGSAERPAVAGDAVTTRPPRPTAGSLDLAGNRRLAGAVVATASFATMGIELAASRILAPYLGLSLYSWTGIIGVVLAAITLGNYLGGWIADRWPSQRVLGLSLLLGGAGGLAILVLVDLLDLRGFFTSLGLIERILAETTAVFFIPVLLLGTISPQVIRLAVTDIRSSGRLAGEIYAWSTAGAIVGTFLTGWWLISALGVHALVFVLALVLLVLGLLVGRFWRQPVLFAALLLTIVGAVVGLQAHDALRSRCTVETNYFCIKVGDEVKSAGPVKTLVLDHLVHSYVKLGDPLYLGYIHEQVQAEIARFAAMRRPDLRVLVIGGGGYTFPRWVEASLPRAGIDVVEIDPGVTEVAHDYLGLDRSTRIVSHNLDGRQFVQELAAPASYTLVVQDAVNDLSVPYHIMTREYNDQVRRLLTEDGIYMLTVIDLFRDGQLLRAAARTMRETFPHVQLLAAGPAWESGGANVWIVAGSARGLDVAALHSALRSQGLTQIQTTEMPATLLDEYIAQGPPIILTDQYAPVDNLIAILFRSRG